MPSIVSIEKLVEEIKEVEGFSVAFTTINEGPFLSYKERFKSPLKDNHALTHFCNRIKQVIPTGNFWIIPFKDGTRCTTRQTFIKKIREKSK